MLTHTSTITTSVTEELTVPSSWGMPTKAGDKSLQKKAQLLINEIENSKTDKEIDNAIVAFFKSYRKMRKSKTMDEASKPVVHQFVWSFLEKVGRCTGLDIADTESLLLAIWYKTGYTNDVKKYLTTRSQKISI
jgi:hypothetical protein